MKLILTAILCLVSGVASAQTITPAPGLPLSGGQMTGIIQQSVAVNQTATGTNVGSALQITTQIIHLSTVASGTGVRLPALSAGATITVINKGANTVNVYPNASGNIDGGTANAPVTLAAGAVANYTSITNFVWFTN